MATPGKPLIFKLAKEGSYKLKVEALDKEDNLLAIGDSIQVIAKAPDLLPPPVLVTGKQKLTTGESGDILLKWNRVNGAVKYLVEITGPRTNFRKTVSSTQLSMTNLMPGTHTLILAALDKSGRIGIKSPGYSLQVPDISSIAAPKTKTIKIR
jgi:hypothetical protein